jgi:hypothetical protein
MNMGEAALCNVTEMSPQGGRGGQWARSWNVTTCPVMTLRVSIGVREEHAKVSAHLEAAADTSMAAANFSPQVNGAGEARFAVRDSPPILFVERDNRFPWAQGLDARHTTITR